VSNLLALADVVDVSVFGSKAVGLGEALRAGIPVPPGFALSGPLVESVASADEAAITRVNTFVAPLGWPVAVRSSAVDEDGSDASFAGQHVTLLNITSFDDLAKALREIWWSANSDSAITYRKRVGLFTQPSVAVVVQSLLRPESAGVMFTRNPITGADERMVEASWGLGEAVVAGLVIPDSFRIGRDGAVLESRPGLKRVAIRSVPGGGTVEEDVPPEFQETPCIDDRHLGELGKLAMLCEQVYGPDRDIEWAIADGTLYLLQCRAVTRVGG
jgi:pyruvate,water dikinase